MKYNNKMVISLILLTLFNTGCVKPTEEVNSAKDDNNALVYNEQPNTVTYDNSTPIIYADPTASTTATASTVSNSSGIYDTTTADTTTTTIQGTEHYQPAMGQITTSNNIYGSTSSSSNTIPNNINDEIYANNDNNSYNNGYTNNSSSNGLYNNSYYNNIDDPYTNSGSSSNYSRSRSGSNSYSASSSHNNNYGYSYSNNNSYSSNSNYDYSSNSSSSGGIELQVAAFKDYYSAKEFKNNLSIPPKYSAYIKKGAMNKVIIKGFSSRAEAKALASREFPGAFIVSGSSSSSSYHSYNSPSSYSSHRNNNSYHLNYTTNTSYSSPSYSNSSYTKGKIGIQVGAFSSKSKARSIAKSKAGGKYTAIVKKATVRGRTVYKAIIVGFSSRREAKRAIASGRFGDAFVVSL
jgi:cell division septation protein DedD